MSITADITVAIPEYVKSGIWTRHEIRYFNVERSKKQYRLEDTYDGFIGPVFQKKYVDEESVDRLDIADLKATRNIKALIILDPRTIFCPADYVKNKTMYELIEDESSDIPVFRCSDEAAIDKIIYDHLDKVSSFSKVDQIEMFDEWMKYYKEHVPVFISYDLDWSVIDMLYKDNSIIPLAMYTVAETNVFLNILQNEPGYKYFEVKAKENDTPFPTLELIPHGFKSSMRFSSDDVDEVRKRIETICYQG